MPSRFKESLIFKIVGIFLLFFVAALLIESLNPDYLLGADPYFHIKRSFLIRQGEGAWDFPYLPFTADRVHFWRLPFFHCLLIPFTFGNLFWGAKIAIAVFNGAIFALFYYLLAQNQTQKPFFWCLFLFFVSPLFLFRLHLLRPHLVSIFLLLLATHFLIFKKNNLGLFWVAFAWVIFYRFPYPLATLFLAYLLACFLGRIKVEWRAIISAVLGTFVGFLIIPRISERVYQIYLVFKSIYLVNIQDIDLHFGGELYPLNFDVIWLFITIFAIFAVISPLLWFNRSEVKSVNQKRQVLTLLLSTFLFLLMTFKGRRFAEYLIPLSVLTISYLGGKLLSCWPVFSKFKALFQERAFQVLIIVLGIFVIGLTLFTPIEGLVNAQEREETIAAGYWLNQHTSPGDIIFHNNWGDFTLLFFNNSEARYIIGIDPITLYDSNPQLYWYWYNISNCGLVTTNPFLCDALLRDEEDRTKFLNSSTGSEIHNALRSNFQAQYIFLTHWQDSLLDPKLKQEPSLFLEEFHNPMVKIYRLD